jgi:hypothetical protein
MSRGVGLWDPRVTYKTWPEPVIFRDDLRRLFRGDPQVLRNAVRYAPRKTVISVGGRRQLALGNYVAGEDDGVGILGLRDVSVEDIAGVDCNPRTGRAKLRLYSGQTVSLESLSPTTWAQIGADPELSQAIKSSVRRCPKYLRDPATRAWLKRQDKKTAAAHARVREQMPDPSLAAELGRQAGGLTKGAGGLVGKFLKKGWPVLVVGGLVLLAMRARARSNPERRDARGRFVVEPMSPEEFAHWEQAIGRKVESAFDVYGDTYGEKARERGRVQLDTMRKQVARWHQLSPTEQHTWRLARVRALAGW